MQRGKRGVSEGRALCSSYELLGVEEGSCKCWERIVKVELRGNSNKDMILRGNLLSLAESS